MGWLVLNLLLILLLIAIYQSINHEEESHLGELLFAVCLTGIAFFGILGLQQAEIMEKFLKKTATIEAIIIFPTFVVMAFQVVFKRKTVHREQ